MASPFCCDSIKQYRPSYLDHEAKFRAFMTWSSTKSKIDQPSETSFTDAKPSYAVQLVRQVNFGPLESKRYFVPAGDKDGEFVEVTENDLINANFQKLNS